MESQIRILTLRVPYLHSGQSTAAVNPDNYANVRVFYAFKIESLLKRV